MTQCHTTSLLCASVVRGHISPSLQLLCAVHFGQTRNQATGEGISYVHLFDLGARELGAPLFYDVHTIFKAALIVSLQLERENVNAARIWGFSTL